MRCHDRGDVIAAHLGNGASLCAMRERRSVATSMGFTALEGLMMGQRCGSLDPGVVLYLLESLGMSIRDVSQLLYEQSGLLGVSGISNDMAELEAHAAPEARTAIALFCYRAASEIAALATALGGLDSIVFTAGIGENSSRVRQLIISRLGWLGARLDADANARHERKISSDESRIGIYIIATDEEIVIARATRLTRSAFPPGCPATCDTSRLPAGRHGRSAHDAPSCPPGIP
ncbi:hypothetical protein CU110_06830 [Cobetia sp. ICG0124]|nr:hypothetical protein CU110_06830 [Cobetia sp. ICG0124]